jgi:hypothetical protein
MSDSSGPKQPTRRKKVRTGIKEVPGILVGRGETQQIVDPEEIVKLAAIGCTDREIAEWVGITESALRYNFNSELIKGKGQLIQSLRKAQIRTALDGNPTMLVWLGKNILGQSDSPLNTEDKQPLPWTDDE